MKEKLEQIKENSLRKINESKTINELQEVMKELTSKNRGRNNNARIE